MTLSHRRQHIGLYLHWHAGRNIKSDEIIRFLSDLLRHLRGHVILIWDRLASHRSAKVQRWIGHHCRLTTEHFPPYAPELNPIEYVWSYMKFHHAANYTAHDLADVFKHAQYAHTAAVNNQQLLQSFIKATKLPIKLKEMHFH